MYKIDNFFNFVILLVPLAHQVTDTGFFKQADIIKSFNQRQGNFAFLYIIAPRFTDIVNTIVK